MFAFLAPRLAGTGGSWFLTDIAFYGLKLFSGPIISQSKPDCRWSIYLMHQLITVNEFQSLPCSKS